jgi:hypothetical protein
MTIGIAPCFPEPTEVTHSDDGKTYITFRLNDTSDCCKYKTQEINKAWANKSAFRRECPNHPFMLIMDFIDMSKGAKTKQDWIEKGAEFLGISKDSMRKDLLRISALENELPESPLTYICCYIVNRWAAVDWVKNATPKTLINAGASIVMLDGKLPKRKKEFILCNI